VCGDFFYSLLAKIEVISAKHGKQLLIHTLFHGSSFKPGAFIRFSPAMLTSTKGDWL
jgi:hypothetical protein